MSSLEDPLECPICLDPMRNAVMTNCGHSYCEKCIEEWRSKKNSCPFCGRIITSLTPNFVGRSPVDTAASKTHVVASLLLAPSAVPAHSGPASGSLPIAASSSAMNRTAPVTAPPASCTTSMEPFGNPHYISFKQELHIIVTEKDLV